MSNMQTLLLIGTAIATTAVLNILCILYLTYVGITCL
jgi:hypothetical protein